jgi:hypothetical protein
LHKNISELLFSCPKRPNRPISHFSVF